jgi:23S rRNA pseudouridine955/2504/2580 synthase
LLSKQGFTSKMTEDTPQITPLESPAPGARTAVRTETLGAEDAGSRVDKVLARLLPGVPHTRIFRLLRKGEVRLNGKRVGGEVRVAEGDVLRVPPVRVEAPAESPAKAKVSPRLVAQVEGSILHQDAGLLVINKPAGIAVHGGSGISAGVIESLRASRPDETLELVHRLDRDTSGCLLVARKRSVLRSLHAMLRDDVEAAGDGAGGFDKRYLALVRGKWELGRKRIEAPLRTDTRVGGERTVKVAPDGKHASSEFRVVQFFGNLATLLEVQLHTGRTHQIRVHSAYAGHPVAGDEKYGDADFNRQMLSFGLARLFLHAHSVGFEDPERHVPVSISAPLPPELHAVVDALAGGAGRLKPAGVAKPGIASAKLVRPARPVRAAPRKARSAAARSAPSGRGSRPSRTRSRRDPRT